jgi:hypothetical protein
VKKITFLLTDTTPVRGPYTFQRLRELWQEKKITENSTLFLTERDEETLKVRCFGLTAEQIKENLEAGQEIDVDAVAPKD